MARLSARDVEQFDKRLRARREELRDAVLSALVQTSGADITELAGRVRDTGENSVAELVASMNLTVLDREVNELRDIETALARIADGSYGLCEECGGEIGRERLDAYPTAIRCIDCQRRREIGWAGGRDQTPSL